MKVLQLGQAGYIRLQQQVKVITVTAVFYCSLRTFTPPLLPP